MAERSVPAAESAAYFSIDFKNFFSIFQFSVSVKTEINTGASA